MVEIVKPMKAMEQGNAVAEKASDSQKKGSTCSAGTDPESDNDNEKNGGVSPMQCLGGWS
jgi:hypothetical protein